MNRVPVRALIATMALGLLALLVAACGSGSGDESSGNAERLAFKLTDAGCEPHDVDAKAGPIDFEVENGGSAGVTEIEVLGG